MVFVCFFFFCVFVWFCFWGWVVCFLLLVLLTKAKADKESCINLAASNMFRRSRSIKNYKSLLYILKAKTNSTLCMYIPFRDICE